MKKISKIALAAIAATLSFTACNKADLVPSQEANAPKGNFSIFASISQDTKTVNDGMKTSWKTGDAINVFHMDSEALDSVYVDGKFTLNDAETGQFVGTVGETSDENDWYAFYPYSSKLTTPDNNSCYFNVGCKNSSSTAQVQNGNNSTAHLAGQYFPLAAQVKNVACDEPVSLIFKPVLSIVKFHVTNKTTEPLTVTSLSLTSEKEDIIGSYFINFEDTVATFTPSDTTGKYISNTAKLSVKDGEVITAGDSADFYLAIKPFTNSEGDSLIFNVEGLKKSTITAATFEAGKIKTVNFNFDQEIKSEPDPVVSGEYKYEINCTYSAGNNPIKDAGRTMLDSLAWYINSNSVYFGASDDKGQQFGSSSYPVRNLTMTAKSYSDSVNVIVVKAACGSSANASLSVSVNGVEYLCSGSDSVILSTTLTSYEFVPSADAQKGNIVITYKQPSTSKALYLKYISINEVFAPSISSIGNPADIESSGDTVSVNYSITHPVSGKSIKAVSSQSWVHNFDYSQAGKISFVVDENTDTTARQSVVTVSYDGAEDVKFTVSQKAKGAVEKEYSVTFDFTEISGFAKWGTSYSEHVLDSVGVGTVTFASANHSTQTITDCPVTKGGDVSFVLSKGRISNVSLTCVQWGTKTQTIMLYTSSDSGTSYSTSAVTSSNNFALSSSSIPSNTNAVKFSFSSKSNQIGIKSLTITYWK